MKQRCFSLNIVSRSHEFIISGVGVGNIPANGIPVRVRLIGCRSPSPKRIRKHEISGALR